MYIGFVRNNQSGRGSSPIVTAMGLHTRLLGGIDNQLLINNHLTA